MLIVELSGSDLDKTGAFVKIASVASAIARATGARFLYDAERKLNQRINYAVQCGKLHPFDAENLNPLPKDECAMGVVSFQKLAKWGKSIEPPLDFRIASTATEQTTLIILLSPTTTQPHDAVPSPDRKRKEDIRKRKEHIRKCKEDLPRSEPIRQLDKQEIADLREDAGIVVQDKSIDGRIVSTTVSLKDAPATGAKVEAKQAKNAKAGTGKQNAKWTDAELRTLLDEFNQPGATNTSLGIKHNVSRQRIAILLKEAKEKFRTPSKSKGPFDISQLTGNVTKHKGERY